MTSDPSHTDPSDADAALLAARDARRRLRSRPAARARDRRADAATFLQGPAVGRRRRARARGLPVRELQLAEGPDARQFRPVARSRRPGALPALLPGDIAPSVAKRLSMYVLRSKVDVADVSDELARLGVGGPRRRRRGRRRARARPRRPSSCDGRAGDACSGCPGPRYVVVAPAARREARRDALLRHATAASFDVWRWLTIRAGVPVITAATQDRFVAQTANWDMLGGIDFQKGCYTGQEIIARTQYLGRLKERAFVFHAERSRACAPASASSARRSATKPCGTVVNAAAAPGGGCDLHRRAAARGGRARRRAPRCARRPCARAAAAALRDSSGRRAPRPLTADAMCLALFALDAHPRFALVVAANRDEYHARPAAPAAWWDEGWLAGRDLKAGGTWFGVTRGGALGVRHQRARAFAPRSRRAVARRARARAARAMPRRRRASVAPNRRRRARAATASISSPAAWREACVGLEPRRRDASAAGGDPWPVERSARHAVAQGDADQGGARRLVRARRRGHRAALRDARRHERARPTTSLPATGVTLERERLLSSPFIVERRPTARAARRCSTVDRDGSAAFRRAQLRPARRRRPATSSTDSPSCSR